jgi:hypothetical protein
VASRYTWDAAAAAHEQAYAQLLRKARAGLVS